MGEHMQPDGAMSVVLSQEDQETARLQKYEKSFVGSYLHSLDSKGRLVVPQSFREELGKSFYIAPSKDFSYAALYPNLAWARVRDRYARLGSLNPQLNIFLNQFDALSFRGQECDGQGRILLPQRVREELLFGEKDVEITGANDHVRIISLSRAKAAKESFQNNLPDILAQIAELEKKLQAEGLIE